MKHLKLYEDLLDDLFLREQNSKYKKYIITRVDSDKSVDIYINLIETQKLNSIYFKNKSFKYLYYYNQSEDKIEEYTDNLETDHIASNNIIYQSDNLQETLDRMKKIIKVINQTNKYNLK